MGYMREICDLLLKTAPGPLFIIGLACLLGSFMLPPACYFLGYNNPYSSVGGYVLGIGWLCFFLGGLGLLSPKFIQWDQRWAEKKKLVALKKTLITLPEKQRHILAHFIKRKSCSLYLGERLSFNDMDCWNLDRKGIIDYHSRDPSVHLKSNVLMVLERWPEVEKTLKED